VMWLEAAHFVLGICLSVIVYKSLVKKEDLSHKYSKKFYWKWFSFFCIYTSLYVTTVGVLASHGGYLITGIPCGPVSLAPSVLGISQGLIALLVESFLLGSTLRYALVVMGNVRHMSSSTKRSRVWLAYKFALIVVCQTIPRVSFNVTYWYVAIKSFSETIPAHYTTMVMLTVSYSVTATIVLIGNNSLRDWLLVRYQKLLTLTALVTNYNKSSNEDSSRTSSDESVESPQV